MCVGEELPPPIATPSLMTSADLRRKCLPNVTTNAPLHKSVAKLSEYLFLRQKVVAGSENIPRLSSLFMDLLVIVINLNRRRNFNSQLFSSPPLPPHPTNQIRRIFPAFVSTSW